MGLLGRGLWAGKRPQVSLRTSSWIAYTQSDRTSGGPGPVLGPGRVPGELGEGLWELF